MHSRKKRQKIFSYLLSAFIGGKCLDNRDEFSKLNIKKPNLSSQLHGQMPMLLYTVTTEVCPKVLHAPQCFSFFQKPQEVKENKHQILRKVK